VVEMKEKDGAVTFKARVQPRAQRSEVAGEYNGAIKLRLAAPPVDGKANQECQSFLARLLKVSATSVEIISGSSSRDKVIRIHNISARRVIEALGR
jgi:uncharacterized protein (TIGR00251 family)